MHAIAPRRRYNARYVFAHRQNGESRCLGAGSKSHRESLIAIELDQPELDI